MNEEVELSSEQIRNMLAECAGPMRYGVMAGDIQSIQSNSFGDRHHRLWAFFGGGSAGSIERYYDGFKMVASILGGSPRAYFLDASGMPTKSKRLIDAKQAAIKQLERRKDG